MCILLSDWINTFVTRLKEYKSLNQIACMVLQII